MAAMAELGIDISGQRSKHVRDLLGQTFDYVVTLCGDDVPGACPFFPGGRCTSTCRSRIRPQGRTPRSGGPRSAGFGTR
ncbi:hypothetical protein H5T53_02050 [Candidatus Bipolaricaulota bacterium]|nr:hypothetical protein [Candidatus Bipolaricaulota bacterium]